MILVILKLLVVLIFLAIFIRRPSVVWGIGLLTVTSAVLLDTVLGTFNREELLADLGFFFYVISGAIFAGAATWFWGVVRPLLPGGTFMPSGHAPAVVPAQSNPGSVAATTIPDHATAPAVRLPPTLPADHVDGFAQAGYDRQMLFEEIRSRFNREDLDDLMFDLDINELDVATVGQSMDDLIVRVMDAANRDGKASIVSLAVERILTPPPPHHLPRLEKLTSDSPRTVIRYYLLGNYNAEQLQTVVEKLNVDWEQLDGTDKKTKVRSFLSYLYRRDRISDLLDAMHVEQKDDAGA